MVLDFFSLLYVANFSSVHFLIRISPGVQIFSMVLFKVVSYTFLFKLFAFLTLSLSGSVDSMLIDESIDGSPQCLDLNPSFIVYKLCDLRQITLFLLPFHL